MARDHNTVKATLMPSCGSGLNCHALEGSAFTCDESWKREPWTAVPERAYGHCHWVCALASSLALDIFSLVQSLSHVWLFVTHGLQHIRLPCPSPTPRTCSNSCLLSEWCHPTISYSVVPSPPPSIFPSIRVFSNEPVLHIRWPKYWSFSFSLSPSNKYSGLISFRIDWFDLAIQGTIKSPSPTQQFKSINFSLFNFLYSPVLTSIHDCWKNHSFD